jgi:hypothetical protein
MGGRADRVLGTSRRRPVDPGKLTRSGSARAGAAPVEWPGGLSPPGSPRTVHEPLDSYGSRCSAVSMA